MKYRIPIFNTAKTGSNKIYTLDTVRILTDKVSELGIGINFSYVDEKLVFFCDYIDHARRISSVLNNSGYESYYFFNEDIKC